MWPRSVRIHMKVCVQAHAPVYIRVGQEGPGVPPLFLSAYLLSRSLPEPEGFHFLS